MSPLLFDGSQFKQQQKTEQLEQQLQDLVVESKRTKQASFQQILEDTTLATANDPDDLPPTTASKPAGRVKKATRKKKKMRLTPSVAPVAPAGSVISANASQVLASVNLPPPTKPGVQDSILDQPPDPAGLNLKPDHIPHNQQKVVPMGSRDPREYSQTLREDKINGNGGGLFAAYAPLPKSIRFETQHANEQILMVLRMHPIMNLPWMIITVLLFLAPYVIFPWLPLFSFLPGTLGVFAMMGWYMLIGAYVIESFLNWYYNLYIITDERVIDVDFYSLIYKSVSEAKLEKIEDVTATTTGVLGALFNYGTINIQTAAEKREFEFLHVPQPARVTKFLNELMLEEEREKIEGRVM